MTAPSKSRAIWQLLDFTCIEPYPPDFLGDGIEGISRLVVSPVEQVPVDTFLELGAGDFLFIDTSHTVKTGGDVVFLLQEVLPRLAEGVTTHIHDIFLPWDYPQDWVFAGRAWNEQYAVRAFLAFNSAFEILLSVAWNSHFSLTSSPQHSRHFPRSTGMEEARCGSGARPPCSSVSRKLTRDGAISDQRWCVTEQLAESVRNLPL